jgi:hypothetical protein
MACEDTPELDELVIEREVRGLLPTPLDKLRDLRASIRHLHLLHAQQTERTHSKLQATLWGRPFSFNPGPENPQVQMTRVMFTCTGSPQSKRCEIASGRLESSSLVSPSSFKPHGPAFSRQTHRVVEDRANKKVRFLVAQVHSSIASGVRTEEGR